METALSLGGKAPVNSGSKLTKEKKYLLKKGKYMKVRTRRDQIELAELTKHFNNRKFKFNIDKIEGT